jgi:iron(III) transport system ATP-binding protein
MSDVQITDLRRTFAASPPVAALRGVDLTVEAGQLLAVLGPSGCGKTTLLRCLAGLERADGGTIEVSGTAVVGPGLHVAPERRRIGLVPQEGALFPHLDVARNIAFGLNRSSRAERRERVDELLDLVGLQGLGRRRPDELSGGQQQRVALARALAPRPEVVLLDEPFSALDTSLRASVREEVAATLRAAGTTALLVTHDQVEAMSMADVVAVMRDGAIVQRGTPADVYRRPVDGWTARFLGDAVIVGGVRDGDLVDTPFGRLRLAGADDAPVGPSVTACWRPEQIRRAAVTDAGAVTAKVTEVRFLGPDLLVGLAVGGVEVTARWPSTDVPTPDDIVPVVVQGEVLAFPVEPPT